MRGTTTARFPSPRSLVSLVLVGAVGATVPLACGGDDGGGGTTSGTTGSTTTSTGGTGGAGGAGGGAGGSGGDACFGDAAVWATIPKMGPFPCTKNSDCCVVVNDCLAEAQVVGAADYEKAQSSWPYCPADGCANCIAPYVDVQCSGEECVGYIPPENPGMPPPAGTNHCGEDAAPPLVGVGKLQFTCGG